MSKSLNQRIQTLKKLIKASKIHCFIENLPDNVFVTLNPIFDGTAHHQLLLLRQAVWIAAVFASETLQG
jgi:hypothetical protein